MVPGQGVDYDQASVDYAAHRQVHGGVLRVLSERGGLEIGSRLLEVGCGNGSYLRALTRALDCAAVGLDPSLGMLAQARARTGRAAWIRGRAESLPFSAESFDLVFSVDVIHHVTNKEAFYHEAARVLRRGGRLCTVTDSADIIRRREILSGYFPATVPIELARYPRISQLMTWMEAAGLAEFERERVEEPYRITDAQAYRRRAYSSLHLILAEAWQAGLERLQRDLGLGPVTGVARYACVWARRP